MAHRPPQRILVRTGKSGRARRRRLLRAFMPICIVGAVALILLVLILLSVASPPAGPQGNGTKPGDSHKLPANLRPVLQFSVSPITAPTGTPIRFESSRSYDPDGTIVAHAWTVRRGSPSGTILFENSNGTFNATFRDDGYYYVFLAIQDDRGAQNTSPAYAAKVLHITNRPPVAVPELDAAQPVPVASSVPFRATNSSDADGFITEFRWDFGDGEDGTGPVVTHAFQRSGTFTVRLELVDDDGAVTTASIVVVAE